MRGEEARFRSCIASLQHGLDEELCSDPPGSSLACPLLPPHHPRPGSLAPNFGDHGPSDSALAAGLRLATAPTSRRPARGTLRFSGSVLGRAPLGAMLPRGSPDLITPVSAIADTLIPRGSKTGCSYDALCNHAPRGSATQVMLARKRQAALR
jgi:hypothetical protein